mmetsp:Transcript_15389/g.50338  ORF Transcript_15389/g.50338 Transcript_15389/m.50338 type:complete len:437 (+) Transcript_15389:255-1565(+)
MPPTPIAELHVFVISPPLFVVHPIASTRLFVVREVFPLLLLLFHQKTLQRVAEATLAFVFDVAVYDVEHFGAVSGQHDDVVLLGESRPGVLPRVQEIGVEDRQDLFAAEDLISRVAAIGVFLQINNGVHELFSLVVVARLRLRLADAHDKAVGAEGNSVELCEGPWRVTRLQSGHLLLDGLLFFLGFRLDPRFDQVAPAHRGVFSRPSVDSASWRYVHHVREAVAQPRRQHAAHGIFVRHDAVRDGLLLSIELRFQVAHIHVARARCRVLFSFDDVDPVEDGLRVGVCDVHETGSNRRKEPLPAAPRSNRVLLPLAVDRALHPKGLRRGPSRPLHLVTLLLLLLLRDGLLLGGERRLLLEQLVLQLDPRGQDPLRRRVRCHLHVRLRLRNFVVDGLQLRLTHLEPLVDVLDRARPSGTAHGARAKCSPDLVVRARS